MKSLERGFKAWAERTSLTFRKELELTADDPLPLDRLADYLSVALWTPYNVPGMTKEILDQLLEHDPWGWSGTSLQIDGRGIVIYNPKHSSGRQASDIAHELAHFILDHQPATIVLSADLDNVGMRSFNQKQEDEANCLAWTLLLPREGLIHAKLRRRTVEEIAVQYGVTKSLASYRINSTGVGKQLNTRFSR
jgi:hypothetical protein